MRVVLAIAQAISKKLPRPVRLMEVCGTHTVNIFRFGLRSLLPKDLELLSGPGCPVCVTPPGEIDFLLEVAKLPQVTLATFGDMLRVPGSKTSLKDLRAQGAEIKIIYSPLDTLELAESNPKQKIVFAAIGFETTAPAVAVAVLEAKKRGLKNLLFAVSHRTMPQALRALLSSGEVKLDGLILPGHVSTVIGAKSFQFLAEEFHLPAVVTGFEARDIMEGIYMLVSQVAEGRAEVEIQYKRAVTWEGNPMGKQLIHKVFEPCDARWRGLGLIPGSGLRLRPEFHHFDAQKRLGIKVPEGTEPAGCRCGDILCARAKPPDCKLFGQACTPEHPKGPCMVSSEGTCAAWYAFAED